LSGKVRASRFISGGVGEIAGFISADNDW